ncbi:hypothetical protein EUGRSUZ_G01820 [Eucalyptus grandis]|uniref:Uncharacterized protein n=2 Tax=Eucalyptus grandis TaxID=71139 RepID=A0ACC3K549_EUCGR|nr:hypothetical protein EUGRSUZ_G01820 [Eucalyptus grandis]
MSSRIVFYFKQSMLLDECCMGNRGLGWDGVASDHLPQSSWLPPKPGRTVRLEIFSVVVKSQRAKDKGQKSPRRERC